MKHTIGRPTKRIKARARAIKGAIEPSSACMAAVPSFQESGAQSAIRAARSIHIWRHGVSDRHLSTGNAGSDQTSRAVPQKGVDHQFNPQQGRHASKETVHDNQK